MIKFTRITGKLFGGNANPADDATSQGPEIGQFGSALAATYVGTSDIATIQALPAWQQGFIGAVTPTNQYPPLPEMTGFGKVLSYQQNYLLQQGLAEWDSGTTYYRNNFCSLDGNVYISNTNENTGNNPTADRVNWRIFENGGRSHNLFDTVIKDHILSYADTQGFTIQGGWAYKEASEGNYYGYPTFYNKCISERDAGTQTRITLGSNQIDVYINSNGHVYYNIADRTIVDTYFNTTGVAWLYGIDETNERILMPRNNYFFRMATTNPGDINFPGAPSISHTHTRGSMDITGSITSDVTNNSEIVDGGILSGCFSASYAKLRPSVNSSSSTYNSIQTLYFNAANSWTGSTSTNSTVNNIFGRENNQIMVTSANGILYIVTGNTVDENAITINGALQNALDAIESQEQTSIDNIEDAGEDAVSGVDDAKDAAIQDIQDETATVIQDATEQADRAEAEADRAEAAADVAVAGQMQADWDETDVTKVDYIKNKPDVVTPTNTKTLINKTISASDNTITDLETSNFAPGSIANSISSVSTASSQKLSTEYAVAYSINTLSEQINNLQIAKNPNLSIIGDLNISSGNVSGFTASDYLQFPYVWNFGNYNWTLEFQFTTDSDVTTQQNIINSYYGVAVAVASGHFVLSISSNGTSWDIANSSTGSYSVQDNTTYTLRLSWDGTDYKLAYSLDEETFTNDITVTSSTVHNATQEYVGASPNLFGTGTAYPFVGTINLNKWNLTVNGLVVWYGMDDVGLASRANVSLSNLDDLGEARFINLQNAIDAKSNLETTQNIQALSSGTIALASDKSIYKITPAGATTFTFDITNLSLTSSLSYTFELCVNMSTVYALTFPNSVTWQDATAPDMSSTGLYFLVFRTIDGGTTWLGNLQGKW